LGNRSSQKNIARGKRIGGEKTLPLERQSVKKPTHHRKILENVSRSVPGEQVRRRTSKTGRWKGSQKEEMRAEKGTRKRGGGNKTGEWDEKAKNETDWVSQRKYRKTDRQRQKSHATREKKGQGPLDVCRSKIEPVTNGKKGLVVTK